ncbi:AsmA family protein [Bdellovibrio svalbardensis]|uniref:AsmA-like C-terminal domain-containing protein n=1 Tax=Bdellovibrio svalbardensis TaxID=2972972 RepID=A0ABT6DHU1_9BACT|nr:hypothetical protein [Bdellovibrio svalbardensis]MDG0816366.1 hypothetical protein [Bdellovibrio svalbardensis]
MDRRRNSDKNLVTEQPGMRVLVIGLAVSFFLGYIAKSMLSPARVAARIEKAASHIHKDVKVTFDSAQVSLSNGILPRFSVVITKVQLESTEACWMSPLLEIDELRLPISFWGVLTGTSLIKKVETDNVVLTLRGNLKDCEKKTEVAKQEVATTTSPLVSLSPNEQAQKYKNAVSELTIQNFKILLNEYPQYPSEFLDFAIKVKSFEPKVIEVTAKTHLLRDEQYGDYLSHANLFIEYKESPEPQVQAHFFGNWREGHYSMIGNYTIADHLLNVETDLKHIPLSQVLSLMQTYNLASKELNGKQVWISANGRMTADVRKIKEAPVEVKNFRVEGDLGEMSSEQITFTSLEPLRYKPIGIDVKRMHVGRLLNFLNRQQSHKILGDLGSFSGRAEIRSEKSIRLTGEHTGLEFIFSNKGQRELQVIDRMLGDINLEGDYWTFQVKRVEPRGGNFLGAVTLKADRDFKEVDLKAHIDEMTLAPQVQKLMTNGGEIGIASLNADAKISDGNLAYLKGLLRIEKMSVEGMDFGKTRGEFDFLHNQITLATKIQSLSVHLESPGADLFQQITQPEWWNDQKLEMQELSGQFQFKDLKRLQWKNFQAKLGKDRHLSVDGSWDEQGQLKGALQVRDGKLAKKFLLEGTREEPVFTSETLPAKRMRK